MYSSEVGEATKWKLSFYRQSCLGMRSHWDRFLSKLSGWFQVRFVWLG
jgi:hypothetical protein